jgi:hypothetical protein
LAAARARGAEASQRSAARGARSGAVLGTTEKSIGGVDGMGGLPEVRIWEQRRRASSIAVLGDLAQTLTRPETMSRNENHCPTVHCPLSTPHCPLSTVHCPLSDPCPPIYNLRTAFFTTNRAVGAKRKLPDPPMRSASDPSIRFPVKISSFARAAPTRCVSRWVPPAPGMIPSFVSGRASLVCSPEESAVM